MLNLRLYDLLECQLTKIIISIILIRAWVGELIAHEAEGQIVYWLRGHEGKQSSCFSKIQQVGQKMQRENILRLLKLDFNPFSRR